MKLILFVGAFLLLMPLTFAQKVSYPPAPASVYKPYHQAAHASNQMKNTLWSNDVSDTIEWSFSNSSVPVNNWFITSDASVISTSGPFQAVTVANGFLVFQSDTLTGASSDAYVEFVGAQIDLTGEANIRMQFDQQFISDSNVRIVEVSQDGITWIPFIISDGLTPTGEKMDDLVSINITSVAGNVSDLHYRFHFSGTQEGYWAIDDIELRSIDSVDLRAVSLDWGTIGAWGVKMPYYSVIPSQVQPIEFCAVVANDGLNDLDSAAYRVSIPEVSFQDSDTFSILVNSIDTICLSQEFPINTWQGQVSYYTFQQNIDNQIGEMNTINNVFEDVDYVIDWGWSAHYGRENHFVPAQGEFNSDNFCEYEVGNIIDFFEDETMFSVGVYIGSNAQVGAEVSGSLFKFDTTSNEFIYWDATFIYTITPSDLGSYVELFLANQTPQDPGTSYLVTVKTYGGLCTGNGNVVSFSGKSKPNTSFLIDWTNPTSPYGDWYYLTETPMVALLTYPHGLQEYSSNFNFNIAPNPSNESTDLSFELPTSSEVSIELIDLSGKSIQKLLPKQCFEGRNEIQLETEDVLNGVYFVKLTTDFGSTTKRIIIQH